MILLIQLIHLKTGLQVLQFSKAKEFGLTAVGCASTGNLASATAAHAAKGGFACHVFAPSNIEMPKIAQALSYGATHCS